MAVGKPKNNQNSNRPPLTDQNYYKVRKNTKKRSNIQVKNAKKSILLLS